MVTWYIFTLWKDLSHHTYIWGNWEHLILSLSKFQLYNSVNCCSHHVLLYILRRYSSYSWKFEPFYQPLPISPTLSAPSNYFSTLFPWVWHFLDPMCKWLCSVCLWLISLSIMPSRYIHVIAKARFLYFLKLKYAYIYMYTHTHTHTHT